MRCVEVTLFILLVTAKPDAAAARLDKCEHCRHIARDVFKGIAETAKSHFGGGNTAWEEKALGEYRTSETRFLEVMERPCADRAFDCLKVLEDAEEPLDSWWKARTESATEADLVATLCIDALKLCCAVGHAGRACKPCPVAANLVCGGHGKCRGDGQRSGAGTCQCVGGYKGAACDACRTKFFARVEGPPRTCEACHAACNASCAGPGPADCAVCAPGYSRGLATDAAFPLPCADIDECGADVAHGCAVGTACVNSVGSFSCQPCHASCDVPAGCTGPSASDCNQCAPGSLKTAEGVCGDLDECALSHPCLADQYCTNTAGSFTCHSCDRACDPAAGCTGPGGQCVECAAGYVRVAPTNLCLDMDECAAEVSPCGNGFTCVNNGGSFLCSCAAPNEMINGECVASVVPPLKDEL